MSSLRKIVVSQGRGMVRVRWIDTHDLLTAAVCPGCWNDPERRFVLLKKMEKMGVEPVHKDDLIDGVYRQKQHSPECPFLIKQEKAWQKFGRVMNKIKKKKDN